MSSILISATREQIEAFRRDDPLFCEFLLETGRIVEKEGTDRNDTSNPKK